MAQSQVSTGFGKCFIVFMAIIILIQGVVYLGLSIWGLVMQKCSDQITKIQDNPFKFIIDLVYFADESCNNGKIPIIIEVNGTPVKQDVDMDWGKSHIITNRTYIFMIVYAVVSGLWIVTSLMVLGSICGRITKAVTAICYWPWFLIVLGGSVLDAVATGYFVHDILNTGTAEDAFNYIGFMPTDEILPLMKDYNVFFMVPAIVMTCVSSRVVLVWLLNMIGTGSCLSMSRVMMKLNAERKLQKYSNYQSPHGGNANDRGNGTILAEFSQQVPQQQEQQQQQQQQQQFQQQQEQPRPQSPQHEYIEPYPTQVRPKPLPIQVPRDDESVRYSNSPQSIYPNPNVRTPQPEDNARVNTTYRNTDTHPDKLNYPGQQMRPITPHMSDSALNNRYASADNGFPYPNQQQPPARVSAELRSQLPWSYTSAGTKPMPPPKPQQISSLTPQQSPTQMQAYPEIPEADYGVVQPKSQRISANNDSNNNANDGRNSPQQAYSRW